MNLGQLRTALQALGYTTDTAAQQNAFINMAYREICGMQRWPFLETQNSALVTASGTSAYAPPMADWRNFDAIRLQITATQQYVNLQYCDVQEFRDKEHIYRDISTPFYWTLYAQQIHFYPTPDAVYTAIIDYIKEPVDLAADGDVPVIPIQYHDVLVWGAILAMGFRERDWLGREFANQQFEMWLKRLMEEYLVRQRQTSSHVKSSGSWETQVPFPFTNQGF